LFETHVTHLRNRGIPDKLVFSNRSANPVVTEEAQ
jgi:hypothetical protein